MTFLTVAENLKIGETASQLSFQRFMEFGYFGVHFQLHGLRQPAPSAHRRPDRWFLNPHPGSSKLLYLQEFHSMEHFKQELIEYLDYYNNRRIKAKLKGLPPAIHRQQALSVA